MDPIARRRSHLGNLFVKGLHESIDNEELHAIFLPVGNILACKVSMQEGKSRGYGYVQFETDEIANLAIEKLNGATIKGKKLCIAKYKEKSERITSMLEAEVKFTNVFVKNIDPDTTEDILIQKFAKYGKITSAVIMKDGELKSKGFGFINFDSSDCAKRAIEAMNGATLGSKSIFVGRAQKKAEREQILQQQFEELRLERVQRYQGANLYVKNLHDSVDDEYLQRRFSSYGNIVSAKVMRDERGFSKGFGFVCFASPEEATRALSERGSMVFGKPIYVAVAQSREARHAYLEQLHAQRTAELPRTNNIPAPDTPMYLATMFPPPMAPTQGIGYRLSTTAPPGTPAFRVMPPIPVTVRPHPQRQRSANGQAMMNEQQRPVDGTRAPVLQQTLPSPSAAAAAASVQPTNPADWSSMLASAPLEQQKQMIGNRLYFLIQQLQFNLAGKITGMLLEMDNAELLLLLESPALLAAKVEEAVEVLQQAAIDGQICI